MRFAVSDLLAVALLVALATTSFVKRDAISAAAAQLDALHAEITQAADDCQ